MEIVHMGETAWLARENGRGILIDTGRRPDAARIIRKIRELHVKVAIIFLTHTHYDHSGGAEALRLATGARVMVAKEEAAFLRNGQTPIPSGTGSIGRFLLRLASLSGNTSRDHYHPVKSEITEVERNGPVEGFGSDVWVYRLGAHTAGSIGLKVNNAFFAGDTVFGLGSAIYPPFADREEEFPKAWSTILSSGAEKIYPGHGRPFSIRVLEKQYQKRFKTKGQDGSN